MSSFRLASVLGATLALAASVAAGEEKEETRTLRVPYRGGERTARCLVVAPPRVEAGRKMPMLLGLHGAMLNERVEARPWREPCARYGYLLVSAKSAGATWDQEDIPMLDAVAAEVMRDFPVDAARVFLTGFSSGGRLAMIYGPRRADLFAGVIAMSSPWGESGAAEIAAEKGSRLPFFVTHGVEDSVVPFRQSAPAVAALKAAGHEVTFLKVAGLGHTIPRDRLDQVFQWMAAHAKAAAGPADVLDPRAMPAADRPTALEIGDPCPDFTVTSLQGVTYTREAIVGRRALALIFSGASGGAADRAPMEEVTRRWAEKVQVIVVRPSVPLGKTGEEMVRRLKVAFPIVKDPDEEVNKVFKVRRAPATLIFDRGGRLIDMGPKPGENTDPTLAARAMHLAFARHFSDSNAERAAAADEARRTLFPPPARGKAGPVEPAAGDDF
ncbi:MAG: prolyl oligopeptidase family serine peptidase [Planctomycetes bacterium]|nr:prolyl oligopeptidase family serine peptidase [Planctomycetota bacterium]